MVRFDGTTWEVFTFAPPRTRIWDIIVSSNGLIWLALDTHVVQFDPTSQRFTTFAPTDHPNQWSRQIVESQDGSLWIAGTYSIIQLTPPQDGDGEPVWVVHDLSTLSEPMTAAISYEIVLSGNNEIWAVGLESIARFTPAAEKWVVYNYENTNGAMPKSIPWSTIADSNGSIWLGYVQDGLLQIIPDKDQGDPTWIIHRNNGLENREFLVAEAGLDGSVWFITDGQDPAVLRCVNQED